MPLKNSTNEVYPVTLSIGKFLITDSDATTTILSVTKQSTIKPVVVYDSFNRDDSELTLGDADTGQTWEALVGTWGISSNQAYAAAFSSSFAKAAIDAGISDCRVSVKIAVEDSNYPRLAFRISDTINEFVFANNADGYLSLSKRIAGGTTQLAENQSYSVAAGTVLSVVLNGTNIKAYFDGVLAFDITESFNQTATKHGIQVYSNTLPRFDNFAVEAL